MCGMITHSDLAALGIIILDMIEEKTFLDSINRMLSERIKATNAPVEAVRAGILADMKEEREAALRKEAGAAN